MLKKEDDENPVEDDDGQPKVTSIVPMMSRTSVCIMQRITLRKEGMKVAKERHVEHPAQYVKTKE